MQIDPTAFLPPAGAPLPEFGAVRPASREFAAWLQDGLAETNRQLGDADREIARLALGETDNLHQVMMALNKATTTFQLMVQVRNRMLEAYQDVLRMPV